MIKKTDKNGNIKKIKLEGINRWFSVKHFKLAPKNASRDFMLKKLL